MEKALGLESIFQKLDVVGFGRDFEARRNASAEKRLDYRLREKVLEEVVAGFVGYAEKVIRQEGYTIPELKELIKGSVKILDKLSEHEKMAVGALTTVCQKLNAEKGEPYLQVPNYVPYIGIGAGKNGKMSNFICDCTGEGAGYKGRHIYITNTKIIKNS